MPQIIISYRREDSGVITGRIFDRFVARYGRDAIFRDIDNVPIGVDFRTHIDQVLGASDVVLAIVGPHWAGPAGSPSRLDNAADPVRVEIEAALRKSAPLIPVLVLGATMPTVAQLPESLKDFAYRNAVQLDAGQDFDVHMARVIRAVDGVLGLTVEAARTSEGDTAAVLAQPEPPKRHRMLIGGSVAAVLAMAVVAGWYFGLDRQKSLSPTGTVAVAPNLAAPRTLSPTSTPPTAPAVAPAPPPADPEVVFWQSITASSNVADFEEYLRQYPQGQFAGLARNRLALLRSPPAALPRPDSAPSTVPDVSAKEAAGRAFAAYNRSDFAEAMRWYRKAADAGDVSAQQGIGFLYEKGKGAAQDYPEAMRWYRKAADQGDAVAQFSVGVMYEKGRGVAQDYSEAMRWYRKAADQGNALAQRNIGILYENGRTAPQDYVEAMRWYHKAADQGDALAQYCIGFLYWSGQGVPPDLNQARAWMQKAAAGGREDAKKWLAAH